jgi:hypothetical protein
MPERRTAAPATPDQTIKRTLDPEPETEQQKKSWLDLSLTQVVGGALAAMTAAALGSRFSVAGTVVPGQLLGSKMPLNDLGTDTVKRSTMRVSSGLETPAGSVAAVVILLAPGFDPDDLGLHCDPVLPGVRPAVEGLEPWPVVL